MESIYQGIIMKNENQKNQKKNMRCAAGIVVGILFAAMLMGCGKQEEMTRDAETQETETAGTETAEMPKAADAETEDAEAMGAETEDAEAQEEEATGAETEDAGAQEAETTGEECPVTMAELLSESGNVPDTVQPPKLPETVLWFNASYACLTYANGWNWRWVGGQEPTEDNARMAQYLLYSSWNVTDRESGIETVNNLLEGGHRAKCRECMDDLEEWGLMDLKEARFAEEMTKIINGERTDINLGDVPGRYVLAYYMHHEGIDPEYIAAWDLCRVNQLYADFYLCGFMDYEEAMDASLENSRRLQKMYDSWDEMMEAYMLGYQFWQGDLEIAEDSPTKERRSYYEMLKKSGDNPYELDWDMKLKKSW